VVAVVIQAGAVLHRRRDPDGGEAEIPQVIQALDETTEVAPPVGVFRRAGRGVEADAVTAEVVVARIAVVEAGGDEEVDGLLAEIAGGHAGPDVGVEAALGPVAGAVHYQEPHAGGARDG